MLSFTYIFILSLASKQFNRNDIFIYSTIVHVFCSYNSISERMVGQIILIICCQIFFPFYIIPSYSEKMNYFHFFGIRFNLDLTYIFVKSITRKKAKPLSLTLLIKECEFLILSCKNSKNNSYCIHRNNMFLFDWKICCIIVKLII